MFLVWLYDRTGSVLVTMLGHASLTANTVFIFTPVTTGVTFLLYGWALTAAFSCLAAVVLIVFTPESTRRHR